MINLHWLYMFAGAVFAGFAVGSARDRTNPKRWGNAAFWALLAVSFWFGDFLGDLGNGVLVLALVALAGHASARPRHEGIRPATRSGSDFSERFGNRLFLPALIIPFTAFVGTLAVQLHAAQGQRPDRSEGGDAGAARPRRDHRADRLLSWLRPAALAAVDEGSRLLNSIGWALVLPQMLAALGAVFAAAGVGTTIGALAGAIIPQGSIFLAVLLYALGMVVFTMIMGNAFAAFPVMAAAIGVPILIHQDGGNAAVIGAVGMLVGLLRDVDDAHGGQLQHRPRRAARAQEPICA